jgi:hypothetical protein
MGISFMQTLRRVKFRECLLPFFCPENGGR